jgi:hypothetical protein
MTLPRGTQFSQEYFDTAVPAVEVEKKMLNTDCGSILMCFEAEIITHCKTKRAF